MTNWIDIAGWTLLHFLWQGVAIALAASAALHLLRSASSQARYVAACATLALMLAAPIVTAITLTNSPSRTLTNAVQLLRSPDGALAGITLRSPQSPRSVGNAADAKTTKITFPLALDTQTLFSTIVALWLAGVGILLTRLAAGCWRVRRLHTAARLEPPSRWQAAADDIARRLDLRRRFSVVDSARVVTPTVVGWLQPIVLLPIAALAGLSPRQVEAILAHELAHIRRHDFIVNLLQTLAETALFYHPAVWWISARIRTEREHCCDDVAVTVCGDAREYAAALAELASWTLSHPPLVMAATRGPLVDRIRRLLRLQQSDRPPRRATLAAAVVVTCAVVAALGAMVKAQPIGVAGDGPGVGPPDVNRLLGFNLFPGPVQLPGADPIAARAWGVTIGGGSGELVMKGFPARSLIRQAYDLERMPVVGGPSWLDLESFDLSIPTNLTIVDGRPDSSQVQAALQEFLEVRLGLATHRETRDYPAYALVLANANGRLGQSLRPSTIDCVAGGAPVRPNPDSAEVGPMLRERHVSLRFCGIDNNFFGLSGARVTMTELAREFHRQHYPLAPDREVVDQTGLTGAYDFELRFGILPIAAIGHANPVLGTVLSPFGIRSVFTALPEQLGLKLVNTTLSREVLVIDQINRPN